MKSRKRVEATTLEKILFKYKKEREQLIIMDDYDGGRARQLDDVIKEITELLKQSKYKKT